MNMSVKPFRLLAVLALALTLAACVSTAISGKTNVRSTFDEARLKRQGAVLLHAVNSGGLIATRWFKIDQPDIKHSFTVYRTDRHRGLDRMDLYDVVMVDPGTYVLYSVFSNCEDGLRPGSTDWDEPMRDEVATPLGMVSWLRSWKPGGEGSSFSGLGIWGGSTGRAGVTADLGSEGGSQGPGTPIAICNLRSPGLRNGQPSLATITVKAGEVVYAGELNINYGADGNCETLGNWMTDNETRQYCGADWVTLRVTDAFSSQAKPFIQKYLGSAAAEKAVVRLAEPGTLVSAQ